LEGTRGFLQGVSDAADPLGGIHGSVNVRLLLPDRSPGGREHLLLVPSSLTGVEIGGQGRDHHSRHKNGHACS
jgi:hypothetical protein